MDKFVQEGNLQFDFSKSKSVWKIEKEISPTMSHCMKCAEFIVRWPGEIWLIEVKDPENPNIPEKYSDEKYKNFVDSLKRNTLFDHELGPKAKDTFLYLYLNNELGGEPLRYLVLLGLDSFKDSYISSLHTQLKRSICFLGPDNSAWANQYFESALVFNIRNWNKYFPECKVKRIDQ